MQRKLVAEFSPCPDLATPLHDSDSDVSYIQEKKNSDE